MHLVTDEQYAQIKQPLRDFYTYLHRLDRQGYNIRGNNNARDEVLEINTKEKELNDIVQPVLHTKYDWLAFYNNHLPTRYGINKFINS